MTSLWDERLGPCQKATRVGLACCRGMGALEGLSWAEASAAVMAGDSVSPGARSQDLYLILCWRGTLASQAPYP